MIRISDRPPSFRPGDLVRHRRYGYRGVVVEYDEECQAPDSWYQRNQTQPVRQQPWYHVFVHETETVTYAAQDNLEADDSGEPIAHPLLEKFFDAMVEGAYIRNQREWTGW